MIRQPKVFVLRHADGRFYAFSDRKTYCGPQFTNDSRDAKRMTRAGAASTQRMLINPKLHGERFEIVHESELPKVNP